MNPLPLSSNSNPLVLSGCRQCQGTAPDLTNLLTEFTTMYRYLLASHSRCETKRSHYAVSSAFREVVLFADSSLSDYLRLELLEKKCPLVCSQASHVMLNHLALSFRYPLRAPFECDRGKDNISFKVRFSKELPQKCSSPRLRQYLTSFPVQQDHVNR